jgi:hypothetical protein
MDRILEALTRKRPVFVAIIYSAGLIVGQNMEVLEQTYAESLAGISAAVDHLQGRDAISSAESLAVLIRTKPSRGTVAAESNQVA